MRPEPVPEQVLARASNPSQTTFTSPPSTTSKWPLM